MARNFLIVYLKIIGLLFLASLVACNACNNRPRKNIPPLEISTLTPITQEMIDKATTSTDHNISYLFLAEVLQKLKDNIPVNIDALEANDGLSAIGYAALLEDPDIMKALLDRGADINVKDSKGDTSLHKLYTYPMAIEFLLKQPSILLHAKNTQGKTPLAAATNGILNGNSLPAQMKANIAKSIQLFKDHNGGA